MSNREINNKTDIIKLYNLYKEELYDKAEKESAYTVSYTHLTLPTT